MIINNNLSALYSSRINNDISSNLQKSMEKLSSGEKINRAGDDAANLSISEKMRSQIRGLNQASKNIGNGISFIQTTEAYLQETTDILQRIRELAIQGANGIYSDEDRMQIQVEVSSLVAEIDRISSSAQFNGFNMLTGRFTNGGINEDGIQFQIGANTDQNVKVQVGNMSATALGLKNQQNNIISVISSDEANVTLATIDDALKNVNKQRADLGATQNKFEMAQKGINVAAENLISSDSRIRDTNMSEEMVNYTKNQILQQSSMAMLSQANSTNESVLRLLLN